MPEGYAQVERIRKWIHDRHEYRYGVSTENTDALDTIKAKLVFAVTSRTWALPYAAVSRYRHWLSSAT